MKNNDNMDKTKPIKDIPIEMAKRISNESGYQEVIIFGYDPDTVKMHVTTYGQSKLQCLDAARIGNNLKKVL